MLTIYTLTIYHVLLSLLDVTRLTHGILAVPRALNILLFTVNHVLLSTVTLTSIRVGRSNLKNFHFMNT